MARIPNKGEDLTGLSVKFVNLLSVTPHISKGEIKKILSLESSGNYMVEDYGVMCWERFRDVDVELIEHTHPSFKFKVGDKIIGKSIGGSCILKSSLDYWEITKIVHDISNIFKIWGQDGTYWSVRESDLQYYTECKPEKEPVYKWWETLKEGDVVKCIANRNNQKKVIGGHYTILKDFNGYICYSPTQSSSSYEEWELVSRVSNIKPNWYENLKVGDFVKCIGNRDNNSSRTVGTTYCIWRDFDGSIHYNSSYSSKDYHEWELFSKSHTPMKEKPKFKLGRWYYNTVGNRIYHCCSVDATRLYYKQYIDKPHTPFMQIVVKEDCANINYIDINNEVPEYLINEMLKSLLPKGESKPFPEYGLTGIWRDNYVKIIGKWNNSRNEYFVIQTDNSFNWDINAGNCKSYNIPLKHIGEKAYNISVKDVKFINKLAKEIAQPINPDQCFKDIIPTLKERLNDLTPLEEAPVLKKNKQVKTKIIVI